MICARVPNMLLQITGRIFSFSRWPDGQDGKVVKCILFAVLSVLTLQYAAGAWAGSIDLSSGTRQVTLLELFTSQGCSSCPSAERWLNEYVDDDDLWTHIVPVVFHVDYWDYIGWKDVYASQEYGERQRDYARAGKAHGIYTGFVFQWPGMAWLDIAHESTCQ